MSLQAGFAEIDITPPLGTQKMGWLRKIIGDKVLDPLFARAAVFESGGRRIALIQLDTARIGWPEVCAVRREIAERHGVPGDHVLLAATHNHAGPAVSDSGDAKREEQYVATLREKLVSVFGQAWERREEAEIGFGRAVEFGVSHNRRVVMRDGTVKTHGRFQDPEALCFEGPIDPELAVIAARRPSGALLGVLVNFACHPTDHGGETCFSAGWPGVLAREMKRRGGPVTLFLNGAAGNISTADPSRDGAALKMEETGRLLAEDVEKALRGIAFQREVSLAARAKTIQLPFRELSEEQIRGTVRGAQRFIDPKIYDREIPALLEKIKRLGTQPAEVQVLTLDDQVIAAVPGELFVQLGLRFKEAVHPRRGLVVAYANGSLGYVPHRAAFERGGYETTFRDGSLLAPEAGDLLIDAALELLRGDSR